jgi:multiple sugar transport system ATP-binding protein
LEVHYGVRPTDMFLTDAGRGVPAQVIVVEPTGAETELLVRVGDDTLTLVIQGRTQVGPEDTVYLGIKTNKVHLFEAGSQRRI